MHVNDIYINLCYLYKITLWLSTARSTTQHILGPTWWKLQLPRTFIPTYPHMLLSPYLFQSPWYNYTTAPLSTRLRAATRGPAVGAEAVGWQLKVDNAITDRGSRSTTMVVQMMVRLEWDRRQQLRQTRGWNLVVGGGQRSSSDSMGDCQIDHVGWSAAN